MASVSTYLNFVRSTEEAFNFYKTVFGTDYVGQFASAMCLPYPASLHSPTPTRISLCTVPCPSWGVL